MGEKANYSCIIPPVATYVGIDPGSSSGAICVINDYPDGHNSVFIAPMSKYTDRDILNVLQSASMGTPAGKVKAVIEGVHSFPGQGVASSFKFGQNYGMLLGFLTASDIPFIKVTPRTWQKYYGMKKDKDEGKPQWKVRLRQRAEELYPDVKLNNQTADSLLISNYCKHYE